MKPQHGAGVPTRFDEIPGRSVDHRRVCADHGVVEPEARKTPTPPYGCPSLKRVTGALIRAGRRGSRRRRCCGRDITLQAAHWPLEVPVWRESSDRRSAGAVAALLATITADRLHLRLRDRLLTLSGRLPVAFLPHRL
jgi:hypothetical protein